MTIGKAESRPLALLDWLWHLRGREMIDGEESSEAVLARVDNMLWQQGKATIYPDYPDLNRLSFDKPFWEDLLGPNWYALVIFDRGAFWIEDHNDRRVIRYELRSLHVFLFCLLAPIIFATVTVIWGDEGPEAYGMALLAFAFLYGANMLLAAIRAPYKVFRAVRGDQ